MSKLDEARSALKDAEERMLAAGDAIEQADEGADQAALEAEFDAAHADVEARKANVERHAKIIEARAAAPSLVGEVKVVREEATYRPDAPDGRSFFRDLVFAANDHDAALRLQRHDAETRAIDTTSGSGGGLVPPVWMQDLWVSVARPARAWANQLPALPGIEQPGMTISVPKVSTGTTARTNVEGASVSSTDITTTTLTYTKRIIAGQQDLSIALLENSSPGLDMVLARDLIGDYNAELDRQLIKGVSASNEHVGLRNVSGVGTVTYTSASPTAIEFIASVGQAQKYVLTNRYAPATHIVLSPKTATWLASASSTSFPVFQQGNVLLAQGDTENGVIGTIQGLKVVVDPNVGVTYGSSTNQSEAYVCRPDDMGLMESQPVFRSLSEVLSGTLQQRIQLYAYSVGIQSRYPASICIISGTGMSAG